MLSLSNPEEMRLYKENEDEEIFDDLPLDVDEGNCFSVWRYRDSARRARDAAHLNDQLSQFRSEMHKLFPDTWCKPRKAVPPSVSGRESSSAMPTSSVAGAAPRNTEQATAGPDLVALEFEKIKALIPLKRTCKDPFDPVVSPLLGRVPEALQTHILTLLTGTSDNRACAMWNSLISRLSKHDLNRMRNASSMRAKALFLERYRNQIFDLEWSKARKSELKQKLENTPLPFDEWRERYLSEIASKATGQLRDKLLLVSTKEAQPEDTGELTQVVA